MSKAKHCPRCGSPYRHKTPGCIHYQCLSFERLSGPYSPRFHEAHECTSRQKAALLAACKAVLDAINSADLEGVVLWINPPHQLAGVHESASERLAAAIRAAEGSGDAAERTE